MYLSFDTSLFWEDYCLVRFAVVHRGRAIPVVWRVMKHESATNRLPSGVEIVLLADRGFIHRDLMKAVKQQLGWHHRIRLKKDCWLWAGKGCSQLKDYHFQRGQALCLQNVRLYKEQPSKLVNVIIGRNNVNGEFWAIVSDEETTLQTYADVVRGWQLIHDVILTSHVDPHPAKASRPQHQQRRDRLQFQVQSFSYAPA